jgi:hypothetical protein
MRVRSFSLIFVMLAIFSSAEGFCQAKKSRAYTSEGDLKSVSVCEFAWDHSGTVSLIAEAAASPDGPGDFTRMRIRVPGQSDFVLANKDGWVRFDSDESGLSKQLRKANLIRSGYFLALKVGFARTLVFLIGYSYGSSYGSLDALAISKDGVVDVAFHRDEFNLMELRDLDGDGIAEVIGAPCLSQTWGDGLLTYDPFHVYKLTLQPKATAALSLPLSKDFNLKHYYGWAGPDCSEEIAVVLHPSNGGKPIVVPASRAPELTRRSKRK